MQRRTFLAGATAAAVAPAIARAQSPNDELRLGWIGCGTRGSFVAEKFRAIPGVKIVAACDVYDKNAAAAAAWVGEGCETCRDFRRVLDRDDVDAVLIATPDHWHAIPTILACQAGKDVYVEKPLGHNVREGQAMIAAARENDRIVQVGTQQHSAPHFERAREIVQRGRIGDVRFVRIWNYRNFSPDGIGRLSDGDPPPGLDWDMYLGPAPLVPFNPNRFINRYRYYWDYSGGVITDWGVHRFESMHQIMNAQAPRTVAAVGGRFTLDDGAETPDVMQATFEYDDFILSYEMNNANAHGCGGRTPGRKYYGAIARTDRPNGLAFYGSEASLFVDRLGFEIYPELKPDVTIHRLSDEEVTPDFFRTTRETASSGDSTGDHVRNFVDCLRGRRQPLVDLQTGHYASNVAHLGNIALKTGSKLTWDAEKENFVGDSEAVELLARTPRSRYDWI